MVEKKDEVNGEIGSGSPTETPAPRPARQADGEARWFNNLWLEVSNVRLSTSDGKVVDVQLKGDKDNRWWSARNNTQAFKVLLEAMEKKRPIHACLGIESQNLSVLDLAIMFAEPPR